MITSAIDKDGVTQTTSRGILHTYVEFLQSKYDPIQVDDACVTQMEEAGLRILPLWWRDFLDTPITEEQVKARVSKRASNKAPGREGIRLEFFKFYRGSIEDDTVALFNHIYLDIRIMKNRSMAS